MYINSINNINFGRIKYEGNISQKHFDPIDKRPEKYLSKDQNDLSKLIEKTLAKGPNHNLEFQLGCHKKTDIHFIYNQDMMSVKLIKKGTNHFGNNFYYVPYNKSETNEIKMDFDLRDKLDILQIRNSINKFIKECHEYLIDGSNTTNRGIEKILAEKW